MPLIKLETTINAPIEVCFDLSRSIDLHKISTAHTGEEAVAGVTSGLINLGETVTWRAKHFGIWQKLTSIITGYERPTYFADEMVKGAFKSFKHDHFFSTNGDQTILVDHFQFESPLGILGRLANYLVLTRYMTKLLEERNRFIKEYAESGKWKEIM
ncbi:MAG: SRPBCC family protein [Bacteroidota bacterium]